MKKFLLFLLILIVALVVGVYNYLDFIAEKAIEKYGIRALNVPISVGKISVKVLDGKFVFKNVIIKNPEGFKYENAIEVGQISAQLDIRTIFDPVIDIKSIAIESPNIFYEIGPNGDNMKQLRSNASSASKSSGNGSSNASENKKVKIAKFFINKAKVIAVVEHVTEKSLSLPDIYIQNIGKDSNGVTVENAADQVLRELSKAITKINVQSLMNDLLHLPNTLDGVKDQLKENVDGIKDNLLNMFNK